MNIHANAALVIAKNHLAENCKPRSILSLPPWAMRNVASQCRDLADKLERHAFTEPGSEAAKLKRAAACQRIKAAEIEEIAAQASNE